MHLILVTHGHLAEAFKETAQMIAGKEMLEDVTTVCMEEGMAVEVFMEKAQLLFDADPQGQFLILADLFGASPCNMMISVFRNADYRMVTGLDLGMLLESLYLKEQKDLDQVCDTLIDNAQAGIKKVFLHV